MIHCHICGKQVINGYYVRLIAGDFYFCNKIERDAFLRKVEE